MIVAELEFFHSRAIAPTRRVAPGDSHLPADPPPGYGGVLLGGVVAANLRELDEDSVPELERLADDIENGRRIPQPRLRHRFQLDRVGLLRSRARLVREGTALQFDFSGADRARPAQRVLAAIYAAGEVSADDRHVVFNAIRRALRWNGPPSASLIAALSGAGGQSLLAVALDDPVGWALETLGFEASNGSNGHNGGPPAAPAMDQVQERLRGALRRAHPDHGGDAEEAAERIAQLREARRILLT